MKILKVETNKITKDKKLHKFFSLKTAESKRFCNIFRNDERLIKFNDDSDL